MSTVLTLVNQMLKTLLEDNVRSLSQANPAGEVFFEHPTPASGAQLRVGLYLTDLRENVKLRSRELVERFDKKGVLRRRALSRLDCHYLISAFTPTSAGALPLHHDLLYEVTEALLHSQPLVPARVLAGHQELSDWPEEYRNDELPLTVNPPEGFPKLAEFWGTMPGDHPWRPVVYAIVTIPVEHVESTPTGVVHHPIVVYRAGNNAPAERAEIGGTVLDKAKNPVGRARVFAVDAHGVLARTTCDDDGRFIVALPPTVTHIYAAAFGLGTTAAVSLADFVEPGKFVLRFS